MKKQFMSALLCGALMLSGGMYTSCSDDDVDDLKSRVTVVEGAIGELKDQLAKALTTGASIVKATQTNGVWTLELSDGQKIVITGSTGESSSVTVTESETGFTITVNGTSYFIPKGAAVSSLVYSPDFADGVVRIDNAGVKVRFLATPAISADALKNATFDIAEAHEVQTRASDLFKIDGEVTLDGDHLLVPLKAIGVEADKSYAVALQMNAGGTSISSNYFIIKVSDDFSFNAEEIGGFTIKSEYNPQDLENNFNQITIKGLDLLKADFSFANLFSELPANAEFSIAPKSKQPGGHAQEKWDILSKSLNKNGAWAFSQRPGTSFNDNNDRPGFLFNIVANDVVKAKIYVVINDELAGADFVGAFTAQAEAEWGGREKSLDMGAQNIDMQATFTNYEEDYTIIHGGRGEFFEQWADFLLTLHEDGDLVYNDGEKLTLGSVAKAYAEGSRGLYWFCRGFAIYVPEALATDGKYMGTDGKQYSGGEGYGYDFWGKQGVDFTNPAEGYMMPEVASWNIDITQDGILKLPDTYTGYGLRLGIGVCYEYAYGVKKIGSADQLGLFFFNRRMAPEGAEMPAPKP